jgi:hypothetical protein
MDDRGQRGVLAHPASQRGVAGRQEDEVIEISAGQAQSAALAKEADPRAAAEHLAALVAGGFTTRNEYLRIGFCAHRRLNSKLGQGTGRKSVMSRISARAVPRAVETARATDLQ